MRCRRTLSPPRRGATAVEAAFVLPVAFTFILGMVVMGLLIYYYFQVASLAREGARYASVHGYQYYSDTGTNKLVSDIYNTAIAPTAAGLNSSNLSYQVYWGTATTSGNGTSLVWTLVGSNTSSSNFWSSNAPAISYNPYSTPPGEPLYNSVRVTVSYQWKPPLYIGSVTLTSMSEMPMSY